MAMLITRDLLHASAHAYPQAGSEQGTPDTDTLWAISILFESMCLTSPFTLG